jgi:hypothetical protein
MLNTHLFMIRLNVRMLRHSWESSIALLEASKDLVGDVHLLQTADLDSLNLTLALALLFFLLLILVDVNLVRVGTTLAFFHCLALE